MVLPALFGIGAGLPTLHPCAHHSSFHNNGGNFAEIRGWSLNGGPASCSNILEEFWSVKCRKYFTYLSCVCPDLVPYHLPHKAQFISKLWRFYFKFFVLINWWLFSCLSVEYQVGSERLSWIMLTSLLCINNTKSMCLKLKRKTIMIPWTQSAGSYLKSN